MEEFIKVFKDTYGLIGILFALPIGALVVVWRQNLKLNTKLVKQAEDYALALKASQEMVTKAQEQRVADAQAVSGKLIEMASESSALNKETAIALDRVSDMLAVLTHGKGQ